MDYFCQLEQRPDKLQFTENIEGIEEWPHSWPDGVISYRLNNFSSDFNQRWQTRAITVALRCWQWRITKLKFRRERNPDAHVDFDISWKGLDSFSSRGVLAHAWFPGQGNISGDVEINDEWEDVAGVHMASLSKPPLVPIMIHEFGHSLGLRHDTSSTENIMYPSFNLGLKKTSLGKNDITRIQERYGKRRLPQWIINYFIRRRIRGSDFR